MERRSSTSSSESGPRPETGARGQSERAPRSAPPFAAIIAFVLLWLVAPLPLREVAVWEHLVSRAADAEAVYRGVAVDQLDLVRLDATPKTRPRVLVMGTSRAHRGFLTLRARRARPEVEFTRIAHAMLDPFVIRSLVAELIAREPDLVVLFLSEFDTHRPLRIEPIPTTSAASPLAFVEVAWGQGFDFSWRNRESFYRIVAAGATPLYRFRDQIGQAGLNDFRTFPLDGRLVERDRPLKMLATPALGRAARDRDLLSKLGPGLRARIRPELHPHFAQLTWFNDVRPGPHADEQMRIVERTVRRLARAGVRTAIIDTPLHPIAGPIQGAGARDEFLRFVERLHSVYGVVFVHESEMEPVDRMDFIDLLHVNEEGGWKLTRGVLKAVDRALR